MSLKYLKQTSGIYQEISDRAGELLTYWNIGLTYEDMGDLAEAEKYITQAIQIAKAISHPELMTYLKGLAAVQAKRRGMYGQFPLSARSDDYL
ncbi:MAG: tetratricopeptide repeat protein [Candidatus Electrothrix sp. YB6]